MGPELRRAWLEDAPSMQMPAGSWTIPAQTVLEIGSGMGDSLIAAAARWQLAIGIDVHLRGLAATVRAARAAGAANVRVVRGDALEVLRQQVPSNSLQEIHVWFPDPWPKARHHKRRLIRSDVARVLVDRLRPGGTLRVATDIDDYADQALRVLHATEDLQPLGADGVVPRPAWRPTTKYEQAGRQAGRTTTDLAFTREVPAVAQAPSDPKRSSAAASSHSTAD